MAATTVAYGILIKLKGRLIMIKELIKIANELDNRGLVKEASLLDSFIIKLAGPDEKENLGQLISLEEYRNRHIRPQRGNEEEQGSASEAYPASDADEVTRILRNLIEKRQKTRGDIHGERWSDPWSTPADSDYIVVLDDGETYSSEASIVKVTPDELDEIQEGLKAYNVVPPDHGADNAKWKDIWDIVRSEDL